MALYGSSRNVDMGKVQAKEYHRQESELAINIRKATSIEEVSPKSTCRTPRERERGLYWHRKTCASMHCLHVGPQEFCLLLAGHESVGQLRRIHSAQTATNADSIFQAANSRRRGANIQSAHYGPQGPTGRPSHRSQGGAIEHQLA
ncbi:ANTH-domain-containing protein [Alternaria alternata]|nr:ANTH-domain-containing protein [Alternaria alternata]